VKGPQRLAAGRRFARFGLREHLSTQQLAKVLHVETAEVKALLPEGLPPQRHGRNVWCPPAKTIPWLATDSGSWRDQWKR
jgi:hypothetical protein